MEKEIKENWEVYISGKTVRELLNRFKDSKAIGLVDIKVKAFIPWKIFTSQRKETWQKIKPKINL